MHFSFWSDSLPTSCNNKVDFPIPGSPPTRVTEPGTNPPPITLSSSLRLVLILEYSFFGKIKLRYY